MLDASSVLPLAVIESTKSAVDHWRIVGIRGRSVIRSVHRPVADVNADAPALGSGRRRAHRQRDRGCQCQSNETCHLRPPACRFQRPAPGVTVSAAATMPEGKSLILSWFCRMGWSFAYAGLFSRTDGADAY